MHQQEPSGRTITIGKTVSALCRLSGEIVSRGQTFCREVAEDLAKARRDQIKQKGLLEPIRLSLPEKYFVLWTITDGVAKAKGWELYGPPEYQDKDANDGDAPDLNYTIEQTIKDIQDYANSPRAVYATFMEAASTLSYDYLETAEEWVEEHRLDPVETVPLELRRAIERLPYLEKIKRVEEILKDVIADLAQALPAIAPQIQEIGRPVGAVVAAQAVRRDAGAEQGGEGMNRPPTTPEAIVQAVGNFYRLLADHVAAVDDQLQRAANPLLTPQMATAAMRARFLRCSLQSSGCEGLPSPFDPLAGLSGFMVEPRELLSWVLLASGSSTSDLREACTRLAQFLPAVEAWVKGEGQASADLIAGWRGARERLADGVKEAFAALPALVAQAFGLPCPEDVKQIPTTTELTYLNTDVRPQSPSDEDFFAKVSDEVHGLFFPPAPEGNMAVLRERIDYAIERQRVREAEAEQRTVAKRCQLIREHPLLQNKAAGPPNERSKWEWVILTDPDTGDVVKGWTPDNMIPVGCPGIFDADTPEERLPCRYLEIAMVHDWTDDHFQRARPKLLEGFELPEEIAGENASLINTLIGDYCPGVSPSGTSDERCRDIDQVLADVKADLHARQGDQKEDAEPECQYGFWRHGANWLVTFDGEQKLIANSRGVRRILLLLRHQGKSISAWDIVQAEVASALPCSDMSVAQALDSGLNMTGLANAGAILDRQSSDTIRNAIALLQSDYDKESDSSEKAMIQDNIDVLWGYLRKSNDHKGRDRKLGDKMERARAAVTKSIKEALRQIRKEHPALADHLAAIKTGSYCCYGPATPVSWKFRRRR